MSTVADPPVASNKRAHESDSDEEKELNNKKNKTFDPSSELSPPISTTSTTPSAPTQNLFDDDSSDSADEGDKTKQPTPVSNTNDFESDDSDDEQTNTAFVPSSDPNTNSSSTTNNNNSNSNDNNDNNDNNNDNFDDDEQPNNNSTFAAPPNSLKGLRACLRCGLIKTYDQFYDRGCDNCPFLDMFEDQKKVSQSTTAFFAGTCSIIDPKASWMAKWLRLSAAMPGIYAIDVTGEFDSVTREMLEQRNINWRAKPA
ncbi:hypothetical protein ScalyP_jg6206 [Parmales sp. scaly parma]|nr:hypothetical protein ScalyP_jg6206 [Parmales sp. scaly parma]|tara:strand:+ start:63 stop:830 length:768 start_codon:yes stop_codon:yes gene_type:complete